MYAVVTTQHDYRGINLIVGIEVIGDVDDVDLDETLRRQKLMMPNCQVSLYEMCNSEWHLIDIDGFVSYLSGMPLNCLPGDWELIQT